MSALSQIYTAAEFWKQAVMDLQGEGFDFQRYELINRVQESVQGQFSDIVSEAYMDSADIIFSSACKYGSNGSFDVDTLRVTSTLDSSFTSADIGKRIIFHETTNGYSARITAVVSSTVVTVAGVNLPAADIAALTYVIVLGSPPTESAIDIRTLRMLRYGNQIKLTLTSDATTSVKPVSKDEYFRFLTTTESNRNTIVWMLLGNQLYINKGYNLASYGTISAIFPRLPIQVSADTDYVDMLDGAMTQIGILVLRNMIAKRMNKPSDVDNNELQQKIVLLYRSFGGNITEEEITQKREALIS